MDADLHAVAQQHSQARFLVGLGTLCALVVIALGVLLYFRQRGVSIGRRWLTVLTVAAVVVAATPVAVSLANALPWWRCAHPLLLSWAAVLGCAGIVAAIVYLTRIWIRPQRRAWWSVLVISGITGAVLAGDALTGNGLQLDSLLGYNPLHAGRFAGFNNPGFAVFGISGVLFAAFLAYGHRRWLSVALVTAVAIPVIALEGLPLWGADAGGILALLPAFMLLGFFVRVTQPFRRCAWD